MEWTQRPGIGPGAEILGGGPIGRRIVELGCGAGRNSAHLAAAGAIVTGVDRSAGQIRRADAHYAHTGARFVRDGAAHHLARSAARLDAIVSVFGAIGTTEPSRVLALCSRRLARRGVLAFAVAHPNRSGALPATPLTRSEMTLPDGTTGSLQHWDIDPDAWARALNRAGLLVTGMIGPLLGLPAFGHIDLPRLPITTSHPDGYLWKRDRVDAWLGTAPAVWIDDDFTALDHRWAADRTAAGHPTLLIQPDHHAGLQPELPGPVRARRRPLAHHPARHRTQTLTADPPPGRHRAPDPVPAAGHRRRPRPLPGAGQVHPCHPHPPPGPLDRPQRPGHGLARPPPWPAHRRRHRHRSHPPGVVQQLARRRDRRVVTALEWAAATMRKMFEFLRRGDRLAARDRVARRLREANGLLAPEHGYGAVAVDTYLVHYRLGEAFDCLVEISGDEEPARFWGLLGDSLADLTEFPALGVPKAGNAEECRRRWGQPGG